MDERQCPLRSFLTILAVFAQYELQADWRVLIRSCERSGPGYPQHAAPAPHLDCLSLVRIKFLYHTGILGILESVLDGSLWCW